MCYCLMNKKLSESNEKMRLNRQPIYTQSDGGFSLQFVTVVRKQLSGCFSDDQLTHKMFSQN